METLDLNYTSDTNGPTKAHTEHSIQQHQNTHSSQLNMEHSQKDCVTVTKQVFANLRGLKSFQVSFLITVVGNQKSVTGRKLEISQISEIKQYTSYF